METGAGTSQDPLKRTLSQNACLPCRNVKMRCRRDPTSAICERCIRKSIDCVFEKHRRGRKPGTRIIKKSQDQTSTNVISSSSRAEASTWPPPGVASTQDDKIMSEASRHNSLNSTAASSHRTGSRIWDESRALQPAELLNKNATTGKFSLQNVLSTANDDDDLEAVEDGNDGSHHSPEGHVAAGLDDPINSKILNFPIALGLFNSFMRSLNPFISQFDPHLHKFEYVQQKSPFLLTSILAAAARAFHPPLYSRLRDHAEHLLARAFTQGTKSPEIVQGILVSTYWKEPDDTRSWLLVGYAIRMAIELGWHKLQAESDEGLMEGTELEIREARNTRRTWLVLFVYDRSISLQVGKPSMIELNSFITGAQDWYRQPNALFGADSLLCAFVTLRILSAEIVELVSPERTSRHVYQSGNLMKLLNASLTQWEEHWHPIAEDERVDHCQSFLIKFYGLHLRLLLNSYSLQESLKASCSSSPISRQAVWTCYSTAIDMMTQISDKFGPFKLLYFAQDSVHVMTAYAAVFLIKLLLSLPSHLSREFETSSIEAIRKAASTFEAQCATQNTGCALQARFLTNIAVKYEKIKEEHSKTSTSKSNTPYHVGTAAQSTVDTLAYSSSTLVNNERLTGAGMTGDVDNYQTAGYEGYSTSQSIGAQQIEIPDSGANYYKSEISDWAFDNNEQWEAMFANAGYRIYDGVFLPEEAMAGPAEG